MRPLFVLAAAALTLSACSRPERPVDAALGDQIRAYILANPEIIEEAAAKLQGKRQDQADALLRSSLSENRRSLERDERDYVAGNPDGAITIVEFFDYRCPYCKAALPDIRALLERNKDVRLVLKEYPILSPASEAAARLAMGAKAQGRYFPVHQALLTDKALDQQSMEHALVSNGVDLKKAQAVAGSPAIDSYIADVKALARRTGVNGTPAFIIGDKMIAGWSMTEVQAAIDAARKKA